MLADVVSQLAQAEEEQKVDLKAVKMTAETELATAKKALASAEILQSLLSVRPVTEVALTLVQQCLQPLTAASLTRFEVPLTFVTDRAVAPESSTLGSEEMLLLSHQLFEEQLKYGSFLHLRFIQDVPLYFVVQPVDQYSGKAKDGETRGDDDDGVDPRAPARRVVRWGRRGVLRLHAPTIRRPCGSPPEVVASSLEAARHPAVRARRLCARALPRRAPSASVPRVFRRLAWTSGLLPPRPTIRG